MPDPARIGVVDSELNLVGSCEWQHPGNGRFAVIQTPDKKWLEDARCSIGSGVTLVINGFAYPGLQPGLKPPYAWYSFEKIFGVYHIRLEPGQDPQHLPGWKPKEEIVNA